MKEYHTQYYEKHQDGIKISSTQYYNDNKKKEYYQDNKECKFEFQKQYREKNKDKINNNLLVNVVGNILIVVNQYI